MLKVIIAGGRTFDDYALLKKKCDEILKNKKDVEIVSGGARGADTMGERYAKENGFPIKLFPADWDTHGRAAGMLRNADMASYSDALIAFVWEESNGTRQMISLARKKGLNYRIIDVNKIRCKHPKKDTEFMARGVFWCKNCRKKIDKSQYIKKK